MIPFKKPDSIKNTIYGAVVKITRDYKVCHGRRRYAFPIRLSRGDDVKVGPRSSDDEVCLSYIYSYD